MANNVGDSITFTLTGAPANGGGYTYCWFWWDGTSTTTAVPTVQKVLNIGGTLSFSVLQSDAYGRSETYNSSIVVNAPPVIIGAPSISQNGALFAFNSVLSSVAYDPEHPGGVELSFAWFNGTLPLGSGTTTVLSTGTYRNQLAVAVSADQTLTQTITDTSNGVTRLNYSLAGSAPAGLQASSSSISNSISNSANNLSEMVIGPGQSVIFTAYARDTTAGQLQFLWTAGTLNGWSSGTQIVSTPSPLPTGMYESQVTLSVANQTAGVKVVDCTVTNLATQQEIEISSSVNLVAPGLPVITGISTDAPYISGASGVSQAGYVHFTVVAADPNGALPDCEWTFTQPAVTLYGQTVMLRPSDYSVYAESTLAGNGTTTGIGPLAISGQITVYDRFGRSITASLSQFLSVLVWPYTQLAASTSGTGSTTLQARYWGVSSLSTLGTSDLSSLSTDYSSTRNMTVALYPNGQYDYILYPTSFGSAVITLNGTVVTDWLLTVATYNAVSYNVYRSPALLTESDYVTVS
jgi:hypothetical protein